MHTKFKGPLPYLAKQSILAKPTLEPILEVTKIESSISHRGSEASIGPWDPLEIEQEEIIETTLIGPSIGHKIVDELWQDIRKLEEKDGVSKTSAPFFIVGLTEYMGKNELNR